MAALNCGLASLADHQRDKAKSAYDHAIKICKVSGREDTKVTIQAGLNDINKLTADTPELAADAAEFSAALSSVLSA